MTVIIIDRDRCTRCGVCAKACPMGIIYHADEAHLPQILHPKDQLCFSCGHCEISCPYQAFTLDILPDEKISLSSEEGNIAPGDLALYLKKRRSVRHFTGDPVPREEILEVLDVVRYAASGRNTQPVQWTVVYDPEKVKKVAGMTIDWMKTLINSDHPIGPYAALFIGDWEKGQDIICRGAPHLILAHIPNDSPIAPVDAIIALTHFDLASPAFGIGTCWAGFVAMAAMAYEPLKKELSLPPGRSFAYAMMFGRPAGKVYGIPRRNPAQVSWV